MPTPTPEQTELLKQLRTVSTAYLRAKERTADLSDQRLALWVRGRELGIKIVRMAEVSRVGSGDVHDGFRKLERHAAKARQEARALAAS